MNGLEEAVEGSRVQAGRPRTRTTPLYIVCSVRRSVGKTLLARLLAEFYVLDGRPVTAFDLGDEEPQLADYLPDLATIGDLGTTRGQMAIFDRIIADGAATKILDVSHRVFQDFFVVVNKIGFFEEARRRSIEPLILFVVDATPKSAKAYALLRERFADASLLAVRNRVITKGIRFHDAFQGDGSPFVSLDVPMLSPSLTERISEPSFSLAEFWRSAPGVLPARLDDELRAWMKRIFIQFREVELRLMCGDILSQLG